MIASFDIGKVNFAFCIEKINLTELSELETIPLKARYTKEGTCTSDFKKLMDKVCQNGEIILLENIDLTIGTDTKKYLDPLIFIKMTRMLDTYKDYWNQCSDFVIEQQMSFGNKRNTMALKLGQHCLSYFLFNYAAFKNSIEFPAYHKTKVLGSPKKMTKYERKTWSVKRAIEILQSRGSDHLLTELKSRKKKDDVADCITMLQAYKFLSYVDKAI